jgi:hypothetical protein
VISGLFSRSFLPLESSDNGFELYHIIKEYMKYDNTERPHQGLEYKRPMEIYPGGCLVSWDRPAGRSQETNLSVNKNCLSEGRSLHIGFRIKFFFSIHLLQSG